MGCPNFFKYHPEALANPEEGLKLYAKKFGHDAEALVHAVEKTEEYQKAKEQGEKQGPDFSTYHFVMHALQHMDEHDKNLVNVVYDSFIKSSPEKNPGRPREIKVYEKKEQPREDKAVKDESAKEEEIKEAYSERMPEKQDYHNAGVSAESDAGSNDIIKIGRSLQGAAFIESKNIQPDYSEPEDKSEYISSGMHIDMIAGNNMSVSLSDIYETIRMSESSQTINLTVQADVKNEVVNPVQEAEIEKISFEPGRSSSQTLDAFLISNEPKMLEYKKDNSQSNGTVPEIRNYRQLILEEKTLMPKSQEYGDMSGTHTVIANYAHLTLEEAVSPGKINKDKIQAIGAGSYTDASTAAILEIFSAADEAAARADREKEIKKTEETPDKMKAAAGSPAYKIKRKPETKEDNKAHQEKKNYSDENRTAKTGFEDDIVKNLEAAVFGSNEKYQPGRLTIPYFSRLSGYEGVLSGIKNALDIIKEIKDYDKGYGAYLRKKFFDKIYSLAEEVKDKKSKKIKKKKLARELDELVMKMLKTKKDTAFKEKISNGKKAVRKKRPGLMKKSLKAKKQSRLKKCKRAKKKSIPVQRLSAPA
jgi:hypothetical protein